jgi:hypothetical protein
VSEKTFTCIQPDRLKDFFAKSNEVAARESSTAAEDIFEMPLGNTRIPWSKVVTAGYGGYAPLRAALLK